MTISFSDLCNLIAESRRLPADFWNDDPVSIRLSKKEGFGVVKSDTIFEVAKPRYEAPSVILRLDENDELIAIEFY